MDQRIRTVIDVLTAQPRDLRRYLAQPGPDFPPLSEKEIDSLIDLLLSDDPNTEERLAFSNLLHNWDNLKEADWTTETLRNTLDRRKRIHELLHSSDELKSRIDHVLPFFPLDEPVIVLDKPRDWYNPQRGVRDYYWASYIRYLRERKNWKEEAILGLDNTTRAILECLANPELSPVYSSRGLVMGYVQSGKTANFAGVIARAADAGYRLIIVLAGTWNILRNQTQRRLDKELLGKELLANDESYVENLPEDWHEFLEHGFDPSAHGYYTWQRLTRPEYDYRRLRAAISTLEFERRDRSKPFYDPANLHSLPVKLLVIKKNTSILAHLIRDLRLLQSQLSQLPALVIDDESDQAGLNTLNPQRVRNGGRQRTATNERMVELLNLLPRCQYIGYTATPYANALIDPDDPEDLFPKDFIVSLERPAGYMGVSDFIDPTSEYKDLDSTDFSQPEIAFIRRVSNDPASDDDDLMRALCSYVLSGAIKLYRQALSPERYSFRHHTMLIHTSPRTAQHADIGQRVIDLWDRCAFNAPQGVEQLKILWNEDYAPVCRVKGAMEVLPRSFDELVPFLSSCIDRICHDVHFVLIVNSDRQDAPDFTRQPVWKIIIGGNKLSRGYTVEGLTVSYYRRAANTADTLMQMGRWFGFRDGYRDLVRVFLGVSEGPHQTDLVSLFRQVCFMEERFRTEIKRYARLPGSERITPKEIPPLISIIGNLPPTSRNKMFNAQIVSRNYKYKWSQPTLTARESISIDANVHAARRLLNSCRYLGLKNLGGTENTGHKVNIRSHVFETTTKEVCLFLIDFRWLESDFPFPSKPPDVRLQIDFLQNRDHGISSWLIIVPQRQSSFGDQLHLSGTLPNLNAKERHRVEGRGFQQFGEPDHRSVSAFLVGLSPDHPEKPHLTAPNGDTQMYQDNRRGIFLLYPVRENEPDLLSVGFEMLYPDNALTDEIGYSVQRPEGGVIVPLE